ncbi:hypothetical protein OUZ56_026279 [Daphnia magna]|uniref:Uncharacterized protein n=1 Tax=Daphnia magna TaxID=35525 RepID=A0ABQ9ZLC1_9CRUS|nr:hypothetical protein OUZ56_026279 [Daphnia magna]
MHQFIKLQLTTPICYDEAHKYCTTKAPEYCTTNNASTSYYTEAPRYYAAPSYTITTVVYYTTSEAAKKSN